MSNSNAPQVRPKGPAQTPPKYRANNPWRQHVDGLNKSPEIEVFYGGQGKSLRGRFLVSDHGTRGVAIECGCDPEGNRRIITLASYDYIVSYAPPKRSEIQAGQIEAPR